MKTGQLLQQCNSYLKLFCEEISERSVGSEGNRRATRFFEQEISSCGWQTETEEFDAIDWEDGGAQLVAGDESFTVQVSPYSLGCKVEAPLLAAASRAELERLSTTGKILLLYGPITREQLMPKNFLFYNPREHQQIIALLEQSGPAAIICATGRNAALAGGVYPFPLIEDGDFDIPSVFMTEDEGKRLLPRAGSTVALQSQSRRIPGKSYNVIARKGEPSNQRIVITAHIDAKKGTPGAIDNATGVIVLLLLARLLADYSGDRQLEIVALNGEDYYAVPGQMLYLRHNQDHFAEIILNINIDGAGYLEGNSAFSFYGLPGDIREHTAEVMNRFVGIVEGVQWQQGDHSIFTQNGCPAIAVSSEWFTDNIAEQEITHTSADNSAIVDSSKVVEIAEALNLLIRKLTQ